MQNETEVTKAETCDTDTDSCGCSPTGGSCLSSPRMCPGFALMGGWLVSYPILYFTGAKNVALIVMVAVAAALMMGLHTKIWHALKGLKGSKMAR